MLFFLLRVSFRHLCPRNSLGDRREKMDLLAAYGSDSEASEGAASSGSKDKSGSGGAIAKPTTSSVQIQSLAPAVDLSVESNPVTSARSPRMSSLIPVFSNALRSFTANPHLALVCSFSHQLTICSV
jgi:hypothetical protein